MKERQRLVINILELLNREGEEIDVTRGILLLIKKFTGFKAVGIRLRKGEDFPYYEVNGFPADFVEAERYLCARDMTGEIIRDLEGNAVLECMCGNIIQGRTNPTLSFFTEGGSFWTNSTTELLASTTEKDRQAHTRNRCNRAGYESVALIPLRSNGETIGLLQLNDKRKDMFTLEMIHFFEGIGASVGIALKHKEVEEILRRDKETFEELVKERTEELLRAQKELDRTKRFSDLGTLAAAVAHELRSPLGVIQTAIYNIKRKRQNPLLDKHLANIEKKVLESAQIINNLLDYSRIKMPQYEKVHIYDVLDECIETVAKRFSKRRISVDKKFKFLKSKIIEADTLQLREIFDNILSNAYQSVPDNKGKIEIHAGTQGEYFIAINFKDNGHGIEERYLNRVFEPFFTRELKGTGLGLAICKELINLHGGTIDIKSTEGKGTTVSVNLPIKRKR